MSGCNLVYAKMFDQCDQCVMKMANKYYKSDEEPPKAILIFDYCSDFQDLESCYLEQNSQVERVVIRRVKWLDDEVFELIKDMPSFANNMYTMLLAW